MRTGANESKSRKTERNQYTLSTASQFMPEPAKLQILLYAGPPTLAPEVRFG